MEVNYLIKEFQENNNLVARDILIDNFLKRIISILEFVFFKKYFYLFNKDDINFQSIGFIAIHFAIKNYKFEKKVPFDFFVKFYAVHFFKQYMRKFFKQSHYVLNNYLHIFDETIGNKEIDQYSYNGSSKNFKKCPIEKNTPENIVRVSQISDIFIDFLKKLNKVERSSIFLWYQGFKKREISKLLPNYSVKHLEYLIRRLRLRLKAIN